MAFFQDCWDVLKVDFIGVFLYFHDRGKFKKSLNATFITLILKKLGASDLKDFCPISLVSGVYKIITKVLANRMRATFITLILKKLGASDLKDFCPISLVSGVYKDHC